MKTEKFAGTIGSAYGKPITPGLKFAGEFQALEFNKAKAKAVELNLPFGETDGFDPIPGKEMPNLADVYNLVNDARKATSRQKAMQAALDAAGYDKPTLESDTDLQVRTIVKALLASGKHTPESAEAAAKATLGL